MPYDDPEPTDPQALVGVELPAGPETAGEMAYAFAEEFARMGYDAPAILRLFQNPFYAGAHRVYRALGHAHAVTIIEQCAAAWGRVRIVDRDAGAAGARRSGEE